MIGKKMIPDQAPAQPVSPGPARVPGAAARSSDIPDDNDFADALAFPWSLIALRIFLSHMMGFTRVADRQGGNRFQ